MYQYFYRGSQYMYYDEADDHTLWCQTVQPAAARTSENTQKICHVFVIIVNRTRHLFSLRRIKQLQTAWSRTKMAFKAANAAPLCANTGILQNQRSLFQLDSSEAHTFFKIITTLAFSKRSIFPNKSAPKDIHFLQRKSQSILWYVSVFCSHLWKWAVPNTPPHFKNKLCIVPDYPPPTVRESVS